jgi:hypothetical protein
VAVSVSFSGKPDVTGSGDFPADAPEISTYGIGEGNLDGAVFKRASNWVSQLFFGVGCEIDAFDFINPKALRCPFCKLAAESGAVNAATADCR